MKVIFSEKAYVSLLCETWEKIRTETGGLFLGFYENETFYIIETIDPGPNSIFEVAYFEYDQKYVNHLINKIAKIYKKNLTLLGLWHRHPGSFDVFSSTDNGTNRQFASLSKAGAISCLVNIDPTFRLTVYFVSLPLKYQKIEYEVGDQLFPKHAFDFRTKEELLDKINNKSSIRTFDAITETNENKITFDEVLNKIKSGLCEIKNEYDIDNSLELTPNNLEKITEAIIEDIDYLMSTYLLNLKISKTNQWLIIKDEKTKIGFTILEGDKIIFSYKNNNYIYEKNLFEKILVGNVAEKESSIRDLKSKKIMSILTSIFKHKGEKKGD